MNEIPSVDLIAEVHRLLQQIPRGMVTTYGDLARGLGDDKSRSARWLGEYLHAHLHTSDCNCHRVVRSNGEVGLYVRGHAELKADLLRSEGVAVSAQGIVDLARRFTQFESIAPFQQLRSFQKGLAARVSHVRISRKINTIAAVDVAYRQDGTACGAYVLLNSQTLQVLTEITLALPVRFPYITGYLTFRELPVMLALCQQAREQGILGDVIFCDGNGQLHPWGGGIATCLGVLMDHPVVGIGKSLICGRVSSLNADPAARDILAGAKVIGRAIRVSADSKPVYISVGHRITLAQATDLAFKTWKNHRIPEPIFLADRLSKRMKRLS